MANSLISETHTAFIRGRNILEGVVILHEVIHELKRIGGKGVLKIDFEKAYDKVRWGFVREVLERKGFLEGGLIRQMPLSKGACVHQC
jgi:hypothetical protein